MSERRRGIYLLYGWSLRVFSLLLSPWLLWRVVTDSGFRRSLPGRLGYVQELPKHSKRVLLHGVSVGEVKALRPLVAYLLERLPEHEIVVSSSTPSGLETAHQAFPKLTTVPFPLDFPGANRRFLRRIRPTSVILAELEIWPNFLRSCSRAGIPLAIVNGRITERSVGGYRRVQKLLPQFDRIRIYCVQNPGYAARFRELDVPDQSVVVTGNLKYDSIPSGGHPPLQPWEQWFPEGHKAVVLASTHEPEESQLLPLLATQLPSSTVIVVVPRHPKRTAALAQELRAKVAGRPLLLRSQQSSNQPLAQGAVLLVDTFGELESIYAISVAAFVGGSLMPHGGQNVLEAAAFGIPVVVGPYTDNFAEEVQLLEQAGGLVRAEGMPVLLESLRSWLENPPLAEAAGAAARAALDSQRGATLQTFTALHQAGMFQAPGPCP